MHQLAQETREQDDDVLTNASKLMEHIEQTTKDMQKMLEEQETIQNELQRSIEENTKGRQRRGQQLKALKEALCPHDRLCEIHRYDRAHEGSQIVAMQPQT